MKSPFRHHYQPQNVSKIVFTSYLHLRLLLSIVIFLGVVLHPTSGVLAEKAKIVIKGSGVWNAPHYTDRQTIEAKIPLQLPQKDGPIEGKGTYRIVGKTTLPSMPTYTMSGPIVLKGQLRKGFLIFSWPDFYYQGRLMPKGTVTPLRLKAKAGSEVVQKYTDPQIQGEGRTTYRLEMPSERWEVLVDGGDRPTFGSGGIVGGISITWRMRIEIEIEDGKYKEGSGVANDLKLESFSLPPGFWTCRPLSGRFPWNGRKFTSMTFTYPVFDVDGSVSGRTVDLSLPDNKYFIAWEAYFNELEALEVFKKLGGQTPEEKVRGQENPMRTSALIGLPEKISAVLRDGWSSPAVNMKAENWERIHVKRIR